MWFGAPVTPGQLDGGLRVVGTCLTADDWVVISSGRGLRPGMTVKPDFGKGLPDRSPALAARTGAGVAAAEQFVDLLSRGEFQKAAERFDDTMKKLAPPAELKKIWEQLDRAGGKFLRRGQARTWATPATHNVFVPVEWEHNTTNVRVVFDALDAEKKISGLWIVPPKAGSMPPGKTTTASQSPLEARLPNGVTVELLGMAESPSKDRPWWRLDGSPLAGRPYDSLGDAMVAGPNETVRELAVQLDHVACRAGKLVLAVRWGYRRATPLATRPSHAALASLRKSTGRQSPGA